MCLGARDNLPLLFKTQVGRRKFASDLAAFRLTAHSANDNMLT